MISRLKNPHFFCHYIFLIYISVIFSAHATELNEDIIPQKTFYVLRHGETDWNIKGLCIGSTDIPLNKKGIEQAHNVVSLLSDLDLGIKTICHSPLIRALQTAEIINKKLAIDLVAIEELKACNWGVCEGKPKGGQEWGVEWLNGGIIENGEQYKEFYERCKRGLLKALKTPDPVLIVAHGGVSWVIYDCLKDVNEAYASIDNCVLIGYSPPTLQRKQWKVYRPHL